jgi:type I restriction enzyme, S subunit
VSQNFSLVGTPDSWRRVPLWTLVRRIERRGHADAERLSLYRDHGVVPTNSRDDNFNKPSEDLSTYKYVEVGDLVLNKMKTWQGSLAVSDFAGIVSPAYYVCKLSGEVHPRFAHHLLRSRPLIAEYAASSKGIRPNQWDLPFEQFQRITVALPPFDDQRRIADFLDAETEQIDRLVELRNRLLEVLAEKEANLFESAVAGHGFTFPNTLSPDPKTWSPPSKWFVTTLSRVLNQLTNGYVGPTRDILEDSGIRYVQGLHIKRGEIHFERRPFYVSEAWHAQRPRIHLRTDDVLIVQTGDIGQVAVVPPGFGAASCHALQIARVRSEVINGPYLGAYLRSVFGYQSLLSRATGALHPHLEGGIRDVPVVVPPMLIQRRVVEDIRIARSEIRRLEEVVQRQMLLVQERRQALITAVVTGQLDPTTARGAA